MLNNTTLGLPSLIRTMKVRIQLFISRFESHALLADYNKIAKNKIYKSSPMSKLLKVIYHPLYGMNNYVIIWGDWLSCDSLRGLHDSQSPQIRKHLCPILWQL